MIRKATPNDVTHIAKLKVEGYRYANKGIISQHFLNSIDEQEEHDNILKNIEACEENKEYHVYVADNIDKILGFCAINKDRDTTYGAEAEIVDLHVSPSYTSMGIGKNMFSYIKEEMKKNDLDSAITWVAEENTVANSFCKKNGGTFVGEKYQEVGMQNLKLNGYKFRI